MLLLDEFTTPEHRCAYLPDRQSRLLYRAVRDLKGSEYQALMDQGWRKFGSVLFRPVCRDCTECRQIRVRTADFRPNRSQRRNLRAAAALRREWQISTCDAPRLELYNDYHRRRGGMLGWPNQEIGAEEYSCQFADPHAPLLELSLWNSDLLMGVMLVDITPQALSGVYHYYRTEDAPPGLGVSMMLQLIETARSLRKPYVYFGYYVRGCRSLEYKAGFRPCEILDEVEGWKPFNPQEPDRGGCAAP